MGFQAIGQDQWYRFMGHLQPAFNGRTKPVFPIQGGNSNAAEADFNEILSRLQKWLPVPFVLEN